MEFRDLKQQYQHLKSDIDRHIAEVIDSASFISGKQVSELEQMLADYVGVKYCISCANGTDAISVALWALGIGCKDAVFVPDFTFFSSGECPATAGAIPVFVDVLPSTYNLDPVKLEKAIKRVLSEGKYTPKAVIAVDLFGLPADYDRIRPICEKYNLLLLEDGAQGFGGMFHDKRACSFGEISITSFFPAKPLGCYGDGGAIFTDNEELAILMRSICVHGKGGEDKYNNIRLGMNSRLDTLQAAILIPKLRAFKEYELDKVNEVAEIYTSLLQDIDVELIVPTVADEYFSSWAQYTIQLPNGVEREKVRIDMKDDGIPTMVYYTKPMHRQRAFEGTDSAMADCVATEELCKRVLCLPIHPYLTKTDCKKVVESLKTSLGKYTFI